MIRRFSPCGPDPAIEPGATFKYQAFFHPFSDADASTAALSAGTSFVAACENGTLPNVCYIDPAFDDEGTGTSGDDHPLGDIRLGSGSSPTRITRSPTTATSMTRSSS